MSQRYLLLILVSLALLSGCGRGSTRVHLSVDHPVALWDQPIRIKVRGLRPHERTLLKATSRDRTGEQFVSSKPLTADSAGRVDLSSQATMRVLWSLRPVGLRRGADFGYEQPPLGATVSLSIEGARTTIHRLNRAHGLRILRTQGFYGQFFSPPKTPARRPGILVFGGSEGGLSTTGIAELYASHGYPSLALAYFAEPGLPHNLVRIPLEYFAHALRWLQQQQGVDPSELAVEGISRGSEAAQLLGIHYPRLVHAVIAMVPANGSYCGITRLTASQPVRCIGPAWTFHGKAIQWGEGPYTPFPFHDERIDGPIFLDCAGADQLWPSCQMAQAIASRLRAHDFQHKVTLLDFPDAGHAVGSLYPNLAYRNGRIGGVNSDSNDAAAATGWPKLLRFLNALAHN